MAAAKASTTSPMSATMEYATTWSRSSVMAATIGDTSSVAAASAAMTARSGPGARPSGEMPAATMPAAVTTSGIVAQMSRYGATSPARGMRRATGA